MRLPVGVDVRWSPAWLAILFATGLCSGAPEARAQGVMIGGLTANDDVCTAADGRLVTKAVPVVGTPTCVAGTTTGVSNGDITASGTIQGGTVMGTTGDFLFLNGAVGNITALAATSAQITDAQIDNQATIKTLTAGTLDVTKDLKVGGSTVLGNAPLTDTKTEIGADALDKLTVFGESTFKNAVTIDGLTTTVTIVNTGNIETNTLKVNTAATLNSLEVTNDALVKGDLTVNGTTILNGKLDMQGNDITGVGTINAGTGNFTFLSAALGNFSNLAVSGNTTLGNGPADVLTVNANSIFNAPVTVNGTLTTSSLEVTNDAEVKGTLTVAKGVTVSESFTVTPGSTISMGGNVVHNVATPILDTDAANKGYVDAGLAKAFKEINRNAEGVALAMAMAGTPTLLPAEKFALTANWGQFEGQHGLAAGFALRLDSNIQFNGGVAYGPNENTVGTRAGIRVGW